jgi:AcrR family transcriptional regulator
MMHAMASSVDESVLEASRRALRRFGYQGLTAERIANEAGLSRVTLHRRGITKELVLAELTTRAVAAYREALWPALTGRGGGRERLERALGALCDVAEANLELLVALRARTDAIFHEDGADADVMTRAVFTEPIARLLEDGIADGSLRALDPEEMATVLFNLVGWSYIHLRTGHRWSAHRARSRVLDLALNGLVPCPGA